MSKTKFTKVAVSENPPEEGTVQMFLTEGGLRKVILYRAKWFQEETYSLYKYYLIESPDREEEMREMLEELKLSHSELYRRLNQANNVYKIDTPSIKKALEIAEKLNQKYSTISDNDKLLQSLKQEK